MRHECEQAVVFFLLSHATAQGMRGGPSESTCRSWLQTTSSCGGQKPWWWAFRKSHGIWPWHLWIKEMSASKPLMRCRNSKVDAETSWEFLVQVELAAVKFCDLRASLCLSYRLHGRKYIFRRWTKAREAFRDLNRMTRAFFVDRLMADFGITFAQIRSFASSSLELYWKRCEHALITSVSNSKWVIPTPMGISWISSTLNWYSFERLITSLLSAIRGIFWRQGGCIYKKTRSTKGPSRVR